jgi:hypothetical protein
MHFYKGGLSWTELSRMPYPDIISLTNEAKLIAADMRRES